MNCRLAAVMIVVALGTTCLAEGSKVSFRADHTLLVDGKPFFPIGLYYCAEEVEDESGKPLGELKNYGFNTLGYYRWGQPDWRKELDRIHRAGLKVWIRGHNGFAIDSPEIEKGAREQVRQTKDHPALLFWEFQDEPLLNKVSIEGSRKGYDLVKREDPHHPMLVVEWPGSASRFHLWKGIGDIFATDLYPIPRERKYGPLPNHDVTQMRDYLESLRKGYGDRPLLLVLQAWAWDPLKDGEHGYPTPQESRFMAYQAVIHGAKGLHYYGQLHCTRPNSAAGLYSEAKDASVNKAEFEKCRELNRKFWDKHRSFFQELAQASHIFVLPDAKLEASPMLVNGPAAARPNVEIVAKQGDKTTYLLTVNADRRKCRAAFRLHEAARTLSEVHVLFENRRVAVKDGTFTDDFDPYAVHVYATSSTLP